LTPDNFGIRVKTLFKTAPDSYEAATSRITNAMLRAWRLLQFHNPFAVHVTVLNHFVYSSDSHFPENP